MNRKGYDLEELVRMYFDRQGFFALRGISYTYETEQITDIDVWLYGRQSASVRTRAVVDVKSKRSPKAFERILWVRGMQLALGCDRAIVATTDRSARVASFARQQNVALLTKDFLGRLQAKLQMRSRMTLEQFAANVQCYSEHKHDGDWLKRISNAKSALLSLRGYRAFNATIAEFRFFAERVETRPRHREQALRCAYLTAALACVALDSALECVVYDDQRTRQHAIARGVTYGDASVQDNVDRVLEVIAEGIENGRVIAKRVSDALSSMFDNVRADVVAEHFMREHNAGALVQVARELDDRAHNSNQADFRTLSTEARSILGVFADFVQAKRSALLGEGTAGVVEARSADAEGTASAMEDAQSKDGRSKQTELFQSRKPQ